MQVIIDGRPLVGRRTGIGVHTAEIARRLAVEPPPLVATHAAIENQEGLERCRFRVDPVASFNLFIGRSLARAARVAAVSRAVAEEAVRGFGVPRSRIAIVPNGVDTFFSPGDSFFSPGGAGEGDYVLFVGTLEPRKGLADLLAAWEMLPAPRPRLVLCGDEGWGSKLKHRAGVEVTGYVDRERLRALYRGARAFVYPSRNEGFGIPPLEAMACGAAVIATRTGAISDYAGDAALLVDPGDVGALRDALARVLRDAPLRRDLRLRAAERASHYRWEASAATMTRLFEEAERG